MSEAVLLAIFSAIAASLAAISGLLWRHVEHCKEVHAKLAEISGDVKRVVAEIGTHETGIRGTLHKHASTLTRHDLEIENMKHQRPEAQR